MAIARGGCQGRLTRDAGAVGERWCRCGGAFVQHCQGVVVQLQRGAHSGFAQQIALAIRQFQVVQQAQVGGVFYAFGNQLGVEHLCQPLQRLQGLQFVAVARQVAAKVLVDFDVGGAQLRPQPQAGAAIAKIVQRQLDARAAQLLAHTQQLGKVAHPFFFGDFQHQLVGLDAVQAHFVHHAGSAVLLARVYQCIRADVDEQPSCGPGLPPLLERLTQAKQVEFPCQPFARGQPEQQFGPQVNGILGAAYQCLVRPHRASVQVGNGLEHVAQRVVAHQAFQYPFVERPPQGSVFFGQVGRLDGMGFFHGTAQCETVQFTARL